MYCTRVEAEVEAQCAKLCRRIGDEVAKWACYKMAGLIGDLMKVTRQKRMMQHQLQAADPHGGIRDVCCLCSCMSCTVVERSKVML